MRFLSLVIAAIFAMSEGKKVFNAEQFKTRMAKGQFNQQNLMRGAKPYNEAARRRVQDDQNNWQISGLYSVQFKECLSFTVQDEDLFSENYISSAADGSLIAEKSFIVFTVCESDYCSSQSSSEKMTFITDVGTFFQAFADFLPMQVEQYCEGCNDNYDYCMGNLDAAQDDQQNGEQEGQQDGQQDGQQNGQQEGQQEGQQDGQQEGQQDGQQEGQQEGQQDGQQEGQQDGQQQDGQQNGQQADQGGRKLSTVVELPFRRLENGQVVQMIDCNMCNAYDCFAQEDEQQEIADDEAAKEYEFEEALNWLGAMSQCQQMDNTYNDLPIYAGLLCNAEGTGVEIGVFVDEDCQVYAPKVSFGKMMSYDDSQYYMMSEEVVEYMFTNDFSCYQPRIQYTNPYQYVADENQDDAQQGDGEVPEASEWCQALYEGDMEPVNLANCGGDDNGDENQEYDENLDTYSWYSYQLSQEQSNDAAKVCQAVKGLNGGHATVYDKKNSGTLYKYKNSSRNGMRPGGVATLVIFLVLVAAAAAAFLVKKRQQNDRKTPLINANDGTMA